jgi:hypothetical protein
VTRVPGDAPQSSSPGVGATPKGRPGPLTVLVLLVGLVLTASLAWVSFRIHDQNESRLLNLQLRQAASVVSAAIPSIQIPLSSAAELAAATDGNTQQFKQDTASLVGKSGPFESVSLWRVDAPAPTLVAVVGDIPDLAQSPTRAEAIFDQTRRSPLLTVVGSLTESHPHIAYASAPQTSHTWVVYAEAALPKSHKLKVTSNSAFSELNYAIYLGRTSKPADLLEEASVGGEPLTGARATATVPFGSNAITLVATPNQELGGTLLARLPWIVGVVGALLSIVAAILADYLVRRRKQAEWLASENRRMYSEQRSIAEVLQHALLPQVLPQIPGVDTAMRYVAGSQGADVGGDWYDVIPLDDRRFVFVLGDVSGRGVEAATIMARLHFAIRAYAVQGDSPTEILRKLGQLLNLEHDESFATILCGTVDVADHTITLVNAGHPPLLLLNGKTAEFVRTTVFPPVGIDAATTYHATDLVVPPGATIVAFTDGLIERRGETIDTGLERLRVSAAERPLALDDLLTKILTESTKAEYDDDTAILAVRWQN